MYIVIRDFNDAQDKHAYHVGDVFPHDGRHISEDRIQDLASGRNFQRVPLIAKVNALPKDNSEKVAENAVEGVEKVDTPEWTAEEIKKMPFMKLKSVAKQHDIEVKDREASDIRADLIEKLGL